MLGMESFFRVDVYYASDRQQCAVLRTKCGNTNFIKTTEMRVRSVLYVFARCVA